MTLSYLANSWYVFEVSGGPITVSVFHSVTCSCSPRNTLVYVPAGLAGGVRVSPLRLSIRSGTSVGISGRIKSINCTISQLKKASEVKCTYTDSYQYQQHDCYQMYITLTA